MSKSLLAIFSISITKLILVFFPFVVLVLLSLTHSKNRKGVVLVGARECTEWRRIENISTTSTNTIYINASTYPVSNANPYLTLQGELRYGQTLIVDGLTSLNDGDTQNCTGIDMPLLLCPGSTVIVRNSKLRSIRVLSIARDIYAGNQCANFCGFPPNVDVTNLPHDSANSSYIINVQIYNNTIRTHDFLDSGITFENLNRFDCVAFNNTRISLKISNNNIQFHSGYAMYIAVQNAVGQDGSLWPANQPRNTIRNFYRGVLIENNIVNMITCRDGTTALARKLLYLEAIFCDEKYRFCTTLFSGAEGNVDIVNNFYDQECKDQILIGPLSIDEVVWVELTTFGTNPSLGSPLIVNVSKNSISASKRVSIVKINIHHSRIGYPQGYYLARENNDGFLDIISSSLSAPKIVVEGNYLFFGNAALFSQRHVEASYMMDIQAPGIREYLEGRHAGTSLQSILNSNQTLFNLYYYPEKDIFGSIEIRNNRFVVKMPIQPMSYWTHDTVNHTDFSNEFVLICTILEKTLPSLYTNYFLPVNKQTQVPLNGAKYNYSSFLFTLDRVTIQNNDFLCDGCFSVVFIFFQSFFRSKVVNISNYTMNPIINQGNYTGNVLNSSSKAEDAVSMLGVRGIRFRAPATIEALEISHGNFTMIKTDEDQRYAAGVSPVMTEGIFGLVSLKVVDLHAFGRFHSMSFRIEFKHIFANHYTSVFDFSNLLTSKFEPRWEIRNIFMDSVQTNTKKIGAIQQAVYIRNFVFPSGTVIIDNITLVVSAAAPSAAVSFESSTLLECDHLTISNILTMGETVVHHRAVSIESVYSFVRRSIVITNITHGARAFIYGEFFLLGSAGNKAVVARSSAAVFFTGFFEDFTVPPNSVDDAPPFQPYYRNNIGKNGAISDSPLFLEITNIYSKIEPGFTMPAGLLYFTGRGLNSRSEWNNNNNNIGISITLRNATFIAGRADGNLSSIDPAETVARATAEQMPVYRFVASVMVWPPTTWRMYLNDDDVFLSLRDPRVNKFFPSLSSSAFNSSQNFVVRDAIQYAEKDAASQALYVMAGDPSGVDLTESTSDLMTALSFIPGPPTAAPPNYNPPIKLHLTNFHAETAIVPLLSKSSTDGGVKLKFEDFFNFTLDPIALSSTSPNSMMMLFRRGPKVASITLKDIFAPLHRQLWTPLTMHVTVAMLTLSLDLTATSGLAKLILLPPSTDTFVESKYFNFLKRNKINALASKSRFLSSIGTCGVFLGNRPLSDAQRVINSMAGALGPFNKKPITVHSASYLDQVEFTPCLTRTASKSQTPTIPRNKRRSRTNTSTFDFRTKTHTANLHPLLQPPSGIPGSSVSTGVLAGAAAGSVVVSVGILPSAAGSIARMSAIINVANGIADDDCSGPDELVEPDFVTSPLQITFGAGNGGYLLGTVVGNLLLNGLMFGVTIGGYWLYLRFWKKIAARRMPVWAVFFRDSLSFSGLLVGTEILLYQTLGSALVLIVRRGEHVRIGIKIVAVAFALAILGGCGFWLYKLLFERKRLEKFKRGGFVSGNLGATLAKMSTSARNKKDDNNNNNSTSRIAPVVRSDTESFAKFLWRKLKWFLEVLTGDEGEWVFPSSSSLSSPLLRHEKYLWYYAEPLVEGFTDRAPKFMVVELSIQILLALATMVGEILGPGRFGCLLQGSFVVFVFVMYFLLSILWRPYNDLLSRISTPATTLMEILTLVLALAEVSLSALSGLIVALSSMQLVLTLVSLLQWVLAVGWPAFRSVFIRSRHRRSGEGNSERRKKSDRIVELERAFASRMNDGKKMSATRDYRDAEVLLDLPSSRRRKSNPNNYQSRPSSHSPRSSSRPSSSSKIHEKSTAANNSNNNSQRNSSSSVVPQHGRSSSNMSAQVTKEQQQQQQQPRDRRSKTNADSSVSSRSLHRNFNNTGNEENSKDRSTKRNSSENRSASSGNGVSKSTAYDKDNRMSSSPRSLEEITKQRPSNSSGEKRRRL